MCGPAPLLGLWMPSIDKVGRHFPLMIATTCPGTTPEQMRRHGTACSMRIGTRDATPSPMTLRRSN